MPRARADAASEWDGHCERIQALLGLAAQRMAADRIASLVRKWLPRSEPAGVGEARIVAMTADSVLLAHDLMLFQPAGNGTTPLDRLARGRSGTSPAEASAPARAARA